MKIDSVIALVLLAVGSAAGIVTLVLRRTCLFRHRQKRYVAIMKYGYCPCIYGAHSYRARWVCDVCQAMGQHCIEGTGDWTVEHGKVVADTKKWANFDK